MEIGDQRVVGHEAVEAVAAAENFGRALQLQLRTRAPGLHLDVRA